MVATISMLSGKGRTTCSHTVFNAENTHRISFTDGFTQRYVEGGKKT